MHSVYDYSMIFALIDRQHIDKMVTVFRQ